MVEIVLESFTGPLDLLLHLIRKQEVSIHDIPIAAITDQYLAYVKTMEELSLDLASEFIVMAAWLIAIKSRMLLPRPSREHDEDEAAADPREQLVEQLLAYERFRLASDELAERQANQFFLASREPMNLSEFGRAEAPGVEGVSIWALVDAYRKLLSRVPKEKRVAEIGGRVTSVPAMMAWLLDALSKRGELVFHHCFPSQTRRTDLVSAFLAILELIKDRRVNCRQSQPFDEIVLSLRGEVSA